MADLESGGFHNSHTARREPSAATRSLVFTRVIKHANRTPVNTLNAVQGTIERMSMAQRIKEAREGAKLSQSDLATKVKVSRSAVSQWESGDTKGLRPDNLFAVARATGYSAEWIGTGRGIKREVKVSGHLPEGLDLSFLTETLQAVEEYLNKQELTLNAEPKAKLITLLYEICATKGKVEQPAVARYLRLVA